MMFELELSVASDLSDNYALYNLIDMLLTFSTKRGFHGTHGTPPKSATGLFNLTLRGIALVTYMYAQQARCLSTLATVSLAWRHPLHGDRSSDSHVKSYER